LALSEPMWLSEQAALLWPWVSSQWASGWMQAQVWL
jgi:hypothetical protein